MAEQPGLSDRYPMASPWPVFVALGLVVGELGILFDVVPVAVGGLLLLAGSVAGMAAESGYATTPWRALGACAVALVALGVALAYAGRGGVGDRATAVLAAAAILLAGAVAGELLGGDGVAV